MKTALILPAGPVRWLREKLARIQSAKVLETEAADAGYTMTDLEAARVEIGCIRVTPCLGVDYWRMA